jgi:predicted  nucleic acid-binding Zn-ribbon protein
MTTLTWLLAGVILGVVLTWRLAMAKVARVRAHDLAAMRREINQWQEAAERARAETAQVAHEAETWAAGCKQGREDVISIVPLLMAAQQRQADTLQAAADDGS